MRRWEYTYRTSDGQRHAGEIEAESRDAAFAAIRREMGVKPIRVVPAGGGEGRDGARPEMKRRDAASPSDEKRRDAASPSDEKRRDAASPRGAARWVAGGVLIAAAVAGGAWWWAATAREDARPPGAARGDARPPVAAAARGDARPPVVIDPKKLEGCSAAYREIAVEVDAACETYREASAKIDFELLANYALVERTRDMAEFRAIIAHGREVVSAARDAVRRSVEAHYEDIPPSNVDDRNEAQRLYGLVMEELDATDERLESDECALSLLEANRGKWRVVKGAVIWDDPKLERQFRIFGREPSAGASRWERDFGRGRIESAPVALPPAPRP